VRRWLILDVVVRTELRALVVVAVYLLVAGHNSPGGGFAGGLVFGAALALRFLTQGPTAVRRTIRVAPTTLLGVGLLLALATAAVPLLGGGELLDHGAADLTVPVLGHAHLTSALVFDLGVFLVVVGMVALLLEAFGGPDDDPVDEPPGTTPAARADEPGVAP
jgi:multicomponent Na+:H+ antiporter subunit A